MRKTGFISAIMLACLIAGGCHANAGLGPTGTPAAAAPSLQDPNAQLQAELADAKAKLAAAPDPNQIASLNDELARKNAALAQKDADIAGKQAEIDRLQSLRQQPPAVMAAGPTPGLEGIVTTYDAKAGTVTVNLPGDILFDKGQETLKPSATSTLNKIIAAIQKQYPGKKLFVDGHTDTDPVVAHKDIYDDNRDLSYARAKAVTNYLTDHGISPRVITVRAFGENLPKATKAASRRVEIVVAAE